MGNKVSKVTLENGKTACSFSSLQYVQAAVANVEKNLKQTNKSLPVKALIPLSNTYRPEIDVSTKLDPVDTAYYQSLIGILEWIVELGCVDIATETSKMASFIVTPRIEHLKRLLYICIILYEA